MTAMRYWCASCATSSKPDSVIALQTSGVDAVRACCLQCGRLTPPSISVVAALDKLADPAVQCERAPGTFPCPPSWETSEPPPAGPHPIGDDPYDITVAGEFK